MGSKVGLRLIDPGNYVQTSNNTGIAVVAQMQPITVIFPIPEDDLPRYYAVGDVCSRHVATLQ